MELLDKAGIRHAGSSFLLSSSEGELFLKTAGSAESILNFWATRSQDLETMYHDCGQFYACRTDAFFGTAPQTWMIFFP